MQTSEVNYVDLEAEGGTVVRCVSKRRPKTLYEVEHREGRWLITTNHGGLLNMKLVGCEAKQECEGEWEEIKMGGEVLFPGDETRPLDDVLPLKNHLVMYGREGGIPRVWVAKVGGSHDVERFSRLEFEEDAYDVGGGGNMEYDVGDFLVSYDSLVTPPKVYKVELDDVGERQCLKERVVPGYEPSKYACARDTVKSRDGKTDIPISIVWNKEKRKPDGEVRKAGRT